MQQSTLLRIQETVGQLRRQRDALARVFSGPDGRWVLVSTTLTAAVAISMTWLSLSAAPASLAKAYEPRHEQAALPYALLQQLTGLRAIPTIAAEDSGSLYRAAGLVSPEVLGPLERMFAGERGAVAPPPVMRTLKVRSGDTIVGMLQDAGVPSVEANAVVEALTPIYSPRSIRSGQTFQAVFGGPVLVPESPQRASVQPIRFTTGENDEPVRRLLSLSFAPSLEQEITVNLTGPDTYVAHSDQRKLESRYQRAGAKIESSLYLAAVQAGVPPSMIVEIIRMFSYDVDFQRDVHDGDEFEVFYNHFYTPEGVPVKTGDILSASMTLSGKKHLLYRFETADGDAEYFDAGGRSSRAALMKTPVDGARISSGFGARRHPVLGYTRMHKGIDFAVPSGTPVMAAGSGTVAFAGRSGDYGNLVVIRHGNNFSTAYGHLSRFGQGIAAGARVRQGEVVAYSGKTGLATGPHLHYEIRLNNGQLNPATMKSGSGRLLAGSELQAFVAARAEIEKLAGSLPMQTKLAQVSALRQSRTR